MVKVSEIGMLEKLKKNFVSVSSSGKVSDASCRESHWLLLYCRAHKIDVLNVILILEEGSFESS